MGEDFQAGVCGSTWWSSPRDSIRFSPCLVNANHEYGSFGWPTHDLVEMQARSSVTREVSTLTSNQGSIVLDLEKPSEAPLIVSTLQIMDIGCSSKKTTTTTDWSRNLISGSGSNETNYQFPMNQENMNSSRLNFSLDSEISIPNNQIQKEWSNTSQGFSIHPSLAISSPSYTYPSTLMENLFVDDQLPLENQTMNFPCNTSYQTNSNGFSPSLAKYPSSLRPSLRQQHEIDPSHLTNNNPLWNGSSVTPNDINANIFPSARLVAKSHFKDLKTKPNNGVVQSSKKSSIEPAFKRPRIETPSPLPTFKVRKEKLGDRITALQQLVSPFGKTDTASVLQEAIEYIKLLHDQVNILITPYMKNESPIQHQQNFDTTTDPEKPNQDLRGRGLCLVPISSTYPVASETTVDFWTPAVGGTFR